MADVAFSVFTKHWKAVPLGRLGELVRGMGFEGVELPVRPGFQVAPESACRELPAAARQLAAAGVAIRSVASAAEESTIMACADADVPLLRIMAPIRADESYAAAEERYRREFDALLPVLDRAGVDPGRAEPRRPRSGERDRPAQPDRPLRPAARRRGLGRRARGAGRKRAGVGDRRHLAAPAPGEPQERDLAADRRGGRSERRVVCVLDRPGASDSARGRAWPPSCGGGGTPAPCA